MSLLVNNYYPLDYLALTGIDQSQPADPRSFWASSEELPPTSESLTFNLGKERPVNCISFEIIAKPIDFTIQYYDGSEWVTVTDNTSFNNQQGTTYLGGENPWIFIERHFDAVTTQQIMVTFTRREDPFPFKNSDLFPWSIDVRNLRLLYIIDSAIDYIDDAGTDILGNSFRTELYSYGPSNMTDGNSSTYWKSFPNVDPNAIESLYLDMRDSSGNAIVIDEVYIDPITYGPYMHIYYSNDDETNEWDLKLWTPIPRHYILKKGFHSLPSSTTLKYLKLEFSNLTPIPYNLAEYPNYHSFTYNKFPTWVQNYFQNMYTGINDLNDLVGITDTVEIDPLGLGFTVPTDMLSDTELASAFPVDPSKELQDFVQGIVVQENQIPEAQQELESAISFRNSFQWQDDLTGQLDQNRALTRLTLQMAGNTSSFQSEDAIPTLEPPDYQSTPDLSTAQTQKLLPVMWFPLTCRHTYQVVRTSRTAKIAYYVGIKEINVYRNDYTIINDPSTYVEVLGDNLNVDQNDFIQSDNYWIVGEGLLQSSNEYLQRAKARISATRIKTQSAHAKIQLHRSLTQPANAYINFNKSKTQTATANIQIVDAYYGTAVFGTSAYG